MRAAGVGFGNIPRVQAAHRRFVVPAFAPLPLSAPFDSFP